MRTSWRPGSRRAIALRFNNCLTAKGGYLELIALDGPDPRDAAELARVQGMLESLSREAIAAGDLDEEQAAVLVGSDAETAHRLVTAAIWDFHTDPAFASSRAPDWSMDWPAGTSDNDEGQNRR